MVAGIPSYRAILGCTLELGPRLSALRAAGTFFFFCFFFFFFSDLFPPACCSHGHNASTARSTAGLVACLRGPRHFTVVLQTSTLNKIPSLREIMVCSISGFLTLRGAGPSSPRRSLPACGPQQEQQEDPAARSSHPPLP